MSDATREAATDIVDKSWIDRLAPAPIRPYLVLARMDRPIGTWLLFIPCCWGLSLATNGWPEAWLLVLFAFGSLAMRGAGCTVNDIVDRDFDGRVARTATRPIASGQVNLLQAFAFLGLQLLLGLWVLIQFNEFSVLLGASSLLLVALYPFMKRITYWPQLFLGLTFNWGALMGWAVVHGSLGQPAYLLYAAGIFWTLGYDTIYAHQDKEDDVLIGVKSTAIKFGDSSRAWVFMFYGVTVGLLIAAGAVAGLNWPFYLAVVAASGHLAWQAKKLDINDPKDCLAKFKSNRDVGIIILIGIVAGQLTI